MKRTTLKAFIKDFSSKHESGDITEGYHSLGPFVTFTNNIPENISSLPYKEALKFEGASKVSFILSVKDNHIYYARKQSIVNRSGRTFYITSHIGQYIYIDEKTVKVNGDSNLVIDFLTNVCKERMVMDLNDRFNYSFLSKPSIFKSILVGTIYNEETYYKAIAKRIFKCKELNWRLLKEYSKSNRSINLKDLEVFTTGVNNNLRAYLDASYEDKALMEDLLKCAIKLDQTVKFTWSKKRMESEHQKQIDALMAEELDKKEHTPIYDTSDINLPDNFKLLNTEVDVFKEAQYMHHCLYNCYYNRIRDHRYIAFHITEPEDCTLGLNVYNDGEIHFDQMYLKYDVPVKLETRKMAEQFINDYCTSLNKMIATSKPLPKPKDEVWTTDPFDLPYWRIADNH